MSESTTAREATARPDFVLDLEDPAFVKDPYPTYARLREELPVYQWPGTHSIVFSRYRDVKAIYNDRRISNDTRLWEHAREETWPDDLASYQKLIDHGLFRLSPADHARVRKLVSHAMTPRSVERMRGEIQHTVDTVLAGAIKDGKLNVRELAEPVPLNVISDMLKIPAAARAEFRAFGAASIKTTLLAATPHLMFPLLKPMPRWISMMREVIADRARNPLEDDLLSTLIAARDGAAKLSEDELLSLVHTIITAGSDTTVHATCWAVYTLLRHPEALAEVRADPSLLRNALEETLRFDLFGKGGLPKIVTEDMEVGGVHLRKGQMVFPFVPSALRDPEAFPEPDRFDIRRDLSQTISFGGGQHFCLGAALARMELELAVGTLINRYPDLKLLSEPEFEPNPIMRSMVKLEVSLH